MPAVGVEKEVVAGRFESGANLFEQLFPAVWLGNETAKPLSQHRGDFGLLSEPAAQDNIDVWIDGAQFIENGVPIHHRKEKIQNDQADLLSHFSINFERFKTISCQDHFIAFFRQHLRCDVGYLWFVFDEKNIIAASGWVF